MYNGLLRLADGSEFKGSMFGYKKSVSGEVVFTTGMVGYPESLTDPSFAGQVLVMTYPLVGSYGVAEAESWESERIWISGLVVTRQIMTPSHYSSLQSLDSWLREYKVPALEVADTRMITQHLRERGVELGMLVSQGQAFSEETNWSQPVAMVSTKTVERIGKGRTTIVLIDCGVKRGIVTELLMRGVQVMKVPWNYNVVSADFSFDGVVVSNGPGDPKEVSKTIQTVSELMNRKVPILGICLGNQILALAASGDTYKLKYGHRSQNQPVRMSGTDRCFLTTQNHGYAVGTVPSGFEEWFCNLNDRTNEGIRHKTLPFMSVQFHPEARPGPTDTSFVFDEFLGLIGGK